MAATTEAAMGRAVNRQERRDFSRIPLDRPARLEVDGTWLDCTLVDVSLRGALVRVPRAPASVGAGHACLLVILLDDGAAAIRMRGAVVHRAGPALGVRCRETDLEGIMHLRRLLEVNLADDRLLHRELGALIAAQSG
jgi:hypothetical protein